MDRKQWEVNLTRGIAYRHGERWNNDNAKNMKGLLKDFKVKEKTFFFASRIRRTSIEQRCSNYPRKFQSNHRSTYVLPSKSLSFLICSYLSFFSRRRSLARMCTVLVTSGFSLDIRL